MYTVVVSMKKQTQMPPYQGFSAARPNVPTIGNLVPTSLAANGSNGRSTERQPATGIWGLFSVSNFCTRYTTVHKVLKTNVCQKITIKSN